MKAGSLVLVRLREGTSHLMGSHAKPRTTGRRTAIGALALGATLTGVGLTAAALDPATAVLTASGPGDGGQTQLSGLGDPVGTGLSPAADGIPDLASAPLANIGSATNTVNGTASGALQSAGSAIKTVTSGTLDISSKAPGTQDTIKPIAASAPAGSGGGVTSATSTGPSSGYTAKHAMTRSAPPPSGTGPLASTAASGLASTAGSVLPLAQSLLGNVPLVSSLVQGSGVTGTASGLLGTASGTVGGTADGSSGDPVSGAVGGLPLVGSLLGGSGDGQSSLTVPNLSSLTGSLGGLV
jgi:hypothetical protein